MSKRKKPANGAPRKSAPKRVVPQPKPITPKRGDAAIAQLCAIAADLLPEAAGQARKGRARLLAVVSRILLSEKRIKMLNNDTTKSQAFEAGRRLQSWLNEMPRPKHDQPREPQPRESQVESEEPSETRGHQPA